MDNDTPIMQRIAQRMAEEGITPASGTDIAATPPEPQGEAPLSPEMTHVAQSQPVPIEFEMDETVRTDLEKKKEDPHEFTKTLLKSVVNGTTKFGQSLAQLMFDGVNAVAGTEIKAAPAAQLANESIGGRLIEGGVQFGLGYVFGGKALDAVKWAKSGNKLNDFGRAMAQGAIGDFISFTGEQERLSNTLIEIDNPIVNNAVTQYLAADPDDGDIEGRFKNLLEGAGLGAGVEAVFWAAKGLNHAKKSWAQGDDSAAKKFIKGAQEQVMQVLERNADAVGKIDASITTVTPPKGLRFNENLAPKVKIDEAKLGEVKTQMKLFTEAANWDKENAYKYLDEAIGGVVDRNTFETTDDVAAVMDSLNDVTVPDFKKWTHEEQRRTAEVYGMSVGQLKHMVDLGATSSRALLVSKSMLVDQANVIAKGIGAGMKDEDLLVEMARYKDFADLFMSFRNESGRVLDSNRMKVAISEGDRALIDDYIEDRFGTIAGFDKFKRAFAATGGDIKEVTALMKTSKWEIAGNTGLEIWKNALLSGLRTFNVNFIGSMANSTLQIPIRFMEGAAHPINRVLGKGAGESRAYMGEAAAMMMADVMSFGDMVYSAARLASRPVETLKNMEVPKSLRNKAETGLTRKFSSDYWGMNTKDGAVGRFVEKMTGGALKNEQVQRTMAKAVDVTGSVINAPGTALNIQDGFVQNHARRKQKFALIYRRMMDEKTPIAQMGDRFHELLRDQTFQEEIAKDLDLFAKRTTFQEPTGQITQAVRNFAKQRITPLHIPAFEYLLPFIDTPSNIMKQGLGETNPMIALANKEFWSKMSGAKGGVARDEALGRYMFGSSVAGFTAFQVLNGNITGGGPPDPDANRAWRDAGNRPYSVRFQTGVDQNGNPIYESYEYNKMDPVAFMIGSMANMIEVHHYTSLINDRSDKTWDDYAGAYLAKMNEMTLDKSFFTGVNDFILAISDWERYGAQWKNRFVAGFVPNIFRDIEMMRQDEVYLRDFRELDNAIQQKLIGGSDKVPVTRNRWGDPIIRDKGWLLGHRTYFSPIGMDEGYAEPIDREINRLAVEGVTLKDGTQHVFPEALISMPQRVIREGKTSIPLNAEQYSRLIEIAGKEILLDPLGTGTPRNLRDTLNYLVTKADSYTRAKDYPQTQADRIKQMSKGFDKLAREQLLEEYPALKRQIQEAKVLDTQKSFGLLSDEMRERILDITGQEDLLRATPRNGGQ